MIGDLSNLRGAIAASISSPKAMFTLNFQSGFPKDPPDQQGSQQLAGYFGIPTPARPLLGPVPQDTQI